MRREQFQKRFCNTGNIRENSECPVCRWDAFRSDPLGRKGTLIPMPEVAENSFRLVYKCPVCAEIFSYSGEF